MDIRIKKTQRSIINAFIELRSYKPLERITVKELCDKAEINKSTFYTYFHDLYDLSDQLERDVIQQVMDNLSHPEYVVERPKEFARELFCIFKSQSAKIDTLFSDNQEGRFASKLNTALRELIFQRYPQYQEDPFFNIYLNYAIWGGYYAMNDSKGYDENLIIDAIGLITENSSRVLLNTYIAPGKE